MCACHALTCAHRSVDCFLACTRPCLTRNCLPRVRCPQGSVEEVVCRFQFLSLHFYSHHLLRPPHASARDGREMAYRWFLLALALIIQVESAEVRALLSAPENWTKCTTADQVGKADTQRHADNGMQGPSADFWGDLRAQMPSITLLQLVGAVPV